MGVMGVMGQTSSTNCRTLHSAWCCWAIIHLDLPPGPSRRVKIQAQPRHRVKPSAMAMRVPSRPPFRLMLNSLHVLTSAFNDVHVPKKMSMTTTQGHGDPSRITSPRMCMGLLLPLQDGSRKAARPVHTRSQDSGPTKGFQESSSTLCNAVQYCAIPQTRTKTT